MIEYLLPAGPSDDDATLEPRLEALATAPGLMPFAPLVVDFVAALSRRVLTDRRFRAHPELMALAHWFRASRLNELRARLPNDGTHLRRGVVFHIAPSNVDSVFVYSWLLSLLCGNSNVVRVSRRRSAQMRVFLELVDGLLRESAWQPVAARNVVLSYDHDAQITRRLSAACHLRVVWGGDATAERIRAVPLPALASELVFANRFSMAVLNARTVAGTDAGSLGSLVDAFCADALWFDQQACASPRAVIWVGDRAACTAARLRLWPAVERCLAANPPSGPPASAMDRATTLFLLASGRAGAAAPVPPGAYPARLEVDRLTAQDRRLHDGHGLFLELERATLADVVSLLDSRDQTIGCHGFGREDWLPLLASLPPHAADRIVPVGQALAFDVVWDGVDLLRAFTREVLLRL